MPRTPTGSLPREDTRLVIRGEHLGLGDMMLCVQEQLAVEVPNEYMRLRQIDLELTPIEYTKMLAGWRQGPLVEDPETYELVAGAKRNLAELEAHRLRARPLVGHINDLPAARLLWEHDALQQAELADYWHTRWDCQVSHTLHGSQYIALLCRRMQAHANTAGLSITCGLAIQWLHAQPEFQWDPERVLNMIETIRRVTFSL